MGKITKQLNSKRANAQVTKKSMELAILSGNYTTELANLLLKKGIITVEEESSVSKTALQKTHEEMSEMEE